MTVSLGPNGNGFLSGLVLVVAGVGGFGELKLIIVHDVEMRTIGGAVVLTPILHSYLL